jgi:hypothetical protein
MPNLQRSLSLAPVPLAAMFFAIAAYINIVEQPARLALGNPALLQQWQLSYGTAIVVQAPLAIVAGFSGLAAWWFLRDWPWLVGGVLMLANWPWTLVVMAPINDALMATTPDAANAATRALIEQWGSAHAVRTGLGLVATALFLWAAASSGRPGSLRPS